MEDVEAFLAGNRPDHVVAYLSEEILEGASKLAEQPYAEARGDGVVLIVPGEVGRSKLESAVGVDPMALAREAMGTEGEIDRDLAGGSCPAAADGEPHDLQLLFAFAEEQNEDLDGPYAEGDVIHAYGRCGCGETYSEKWVAGR